jgi:predicted ATPase
MVSARALGPYISYIRFPHYKNLTPDTRINFEFPITALVGVNGTNKSSILRAIQGAPGNENLGVYWFSTSIDPIAETGSTRNSFIYGYHHEGANKVVEVLKTRVKKEQDPDYWEPSRAIASYGMTKMDDPAPGNKSKTRWDTISKPVVYIDFRQSISAFDRCFYYGVGRVTTLRERKEFLRKRSPYLQLAIKHDLVNYNFYRRERIIGSENRLLNSDELAVASEILGREYAEIRWIRHSFFNVEGATCVMKVQNLSYTEAFAGSGEFAVVRLVVDLANAQKYSLVLLDEPEVSLHPAAQERLMAYLFGLVKNRKYQIVLATHSPGIIRWLPPEAIKVLVVDTSTGKIQLPSQAAAAEEAFFYLGEPVLGKITVIVEDELAKHIVLKALRPRGEAFASRFEVKFFRAGVKRCGAATFPYLVRTAAKTFWSCSTGTKDRLHHFQTQPRFQKQNL